MNLNNLLDLVEFPRDVLNNESKKAKIHYFSLSGDEVIRSFHQEFINSSIQSKLSEKDFEIQIDHPSLQWSDLSKSNLLQIVTSSFFNPNIIWVMKNDKVMYNTKKDFFYVIRSTEDISHLQMLNSLETLEQVQNSFKSKCGIDLSNKILSLKDDKIKQLNRTLKNKIDLLVLENLSERQGKDVEILSSLIPELNIQKKMNSINTTFLESNDLSELVKQYKGLYSKIYKELCNKHENWKRE